MTNTDTETAARALVTRIIQSVSTADLKTLATEGRAAPSKAVLRKHVEKLVSEGGPDPVAVLNVVEAIGNEANSAVELWGHTYGDLDADGAKLAREAFDAAQVERIAVIAGRRARVAEKHEQLLEVVASHGAQLGQLAAAEAHVRAMESQFAIVREMRDEAVRCVNELKEKAAAAHASRELVDQHQLALAQLDEAAQSVREEPNPFVLAPKEDEIPGDVLTLIAGVLVNLVEEDTNATT